MWRRSKRVLEVDSAHDAALDAERDEEMAKFHAECLTRDYEAYNRSVAAFCRISGVENPSEIPKLLAMMPFTIVLLRGQNAELGDCLEYVFRRLVGEQLYAKRDTPQTD